MYIQKKFTVNTRETRGHRKKRGKNKTQVLTVNIESRHNMYK